MRARAFVGTSGWVYRSWRKHLYAGVPMREWLRTAANAFGALEINGSFYTQIAAATYARWAAETPADFCFTLKGHRFITHYRRLGDCTDSVIRLRDPARLLGDKLRAVLWQLPSHFALSLERLDGFLRALEHWPEVRHVFEPRHRSWFIPAVADRLAEARLAVCLSDAPDFPMWRAVTTDLVYIRLHGHTRKYASSYRRASLRAWAHSMVDWLDEGREVHAYLDNDAEGHAVPNALTLREELTVLSRAPRRSGITDGGHGDCNVPTSCAP
jgi:uncharacterized protein YecE (DUF72 family)